VNQKLGLLLSIIGKFKRVLNIYDFVDQRNESWILECQDELLYASLDTLKVEYRLTHT